MSQTIAIPARFAALRSSGKLARLLLGVLALCAMAAMKLSMAIPMAHAMSPPPISAHHGQSATSADCHEKRGAPAQGQKMACTAACAALPATVFEFTPGGELRGGAAHGALIDQLHGLSPDIEIPPPRLRA